MLHRMSGLLLAAIALVPTHADNWAVLVAGSSGYFNYRHQADLCHAYKVLIQHGLHPEHVITMLYDDVAHAEDNPFPGELFNRPDGEDVYKGCGKDYVGEDVTPENFIAVLTGDSARVPGRRVLASSPSDHVFVYFVDHGGTGLIAFPNDQVLHALELNAALAAAHAKGLFAHLVFYLETCESGSMFEGLLPDSLPVYAVTAANAAESSWGTYCPPQDSVRGKHLDTCLGDLFSVNFIADLEEVIAAQRRQQQQPSQPLLAARPRPPPAEHVPAVRGLLPRPSAPELEQAHAQAGAPRNGTLGAVSLRAETLHVQYLRVMASTTRSHVRRYGDVAASLDELVADFEGEGRPEGVHRAAGEARRTSPAGSGAGAHASAPAAREAAELELRVRSAVDARHIPLRLRRAAFESTGSEEAGRLLRVEEKGVQEALALFMRIARASVPLGADEAEALLAPATDASPLRAEPAAPFDWTHAPCHHEAVCAFQDACGGWTERMLPYSRALLRLCALTAGNAGPIKRAIRDAACTHPLPR